MFDRGEVRRELQIIHDDLHCNAVRICGQDLDRLTTTAEGALEQGLEVWLSPELWDESPEATLAYIGDAAKPAEELRQHEPDRVVFVVASELTLFMQGIVEGANVLERLRKADASRVRPLGRAQRSARCLPGQSERRRATDVQGPGHECVGPLETVRTDDEGDRWDHDFRGRMHHRAERWPRPRHGRWRRVTALLGLRQPVQL